MREHEFRLRPIHPEKIMQEITCTFEFISIELL
jgi:hypothetical protein